ncbi:hypothetical protein N665_0101s0008 [Sinapis alba]|nr:hypothetical protein N665_0101s0008 [Sinapis alba]
MSRFPAVAVRLYFVGAGQASLLNGPSSGCSPSPTISPPKFSLAPSFAVLSEHHLDPEIRISGGLRSGLTFLSECEKGRFGCRNASNRMGGLYLASCSRDVEETALPIRSRIVASEKGMPLTGSWIVAWGRGIVAEALSDMVGLDLVQRRLVADAETLFLGEREGNGAREGISLESEAAACPPRKIQSDFTHGRLSSEGFVELPPIPSGSRRPPELSDRMEKLVGKGMRKTGATPSSVQAILERCGAVGVTYLIPAEHERLWSPPIEYQCVYEAYFGADTKLWFPIPRLVTSYISRRQVALSQFVNGSYRIAVALMVLSAEIDISLNVRAFEELTSMKALRGGFFAIRMRPNYNIITDHSNKTQKWKKNYFYVKADEFAFHEPQGDDFPVSWGSKIADHPKTLDYPEGFFDSARAIACLSHSRWPDISEDRVRRALERISRVIKKEGGKRLALFTSRQQARVNKARRMDSMIDLSDLIGDELDNHRANPMSILNDMDLGGASGGCSQGDISAEEEKPFVAVASGTQQRGAKRPSRDGDDTSPSNEPSRKRKERSTGETAAEIHVISLDGSASRSRESEASLEGGGSPAARSLDRGGQVDGVDDLFVVRLQCKAQGRLKGRYRLRVLPSIQCLSCTPEIVTCRGSGACIGSSNLLIAKYEGELKSTLVQLGRAQEIAQEKNRSLVCKGEELKAAKRALHKAESRAAKRKKKAKAKISALKLELEAARRSNEELREENAVIQREKEALDREKATLVLETDKEATRLRESRRSSVERERKRVEAAMIEKCDHPFGTRKCLQKLLSRNEALTQGTLSFFEGKERKLKADADAQWVGGIPETDLSLSPLALSPQASRDAERSASSLEGQSVDQTGVDTVGSRKGVDAAEGQGPDASRAGAEDPSDVKNGFSVFTWRHCLGKTIRQRWLFDSDHSVTLSASPDFPVLTGLIRTQSIKLRVPVCRPCGRRWYRRACAPVSQSASSRVKVALAHLLACGRDMVYDEVVTAPVKVAYVPRKRSSHS